MRLAHDKQAYSMTFWTVFFGFVLIPIMALSIEVGRYYYAKAEVAKSADAAALAAAAEINQSVFEQSGTLEPTGRTWANAQTFASMNSTYLERYGISAVVTGISVNEGDHTVQVQVSANLTRLFPSVVPNVTVSENGNTQIRAFTR